MLMPEAAMDKYDFLVARKNDIWFAWKSALVKPEPEPHAMDKGSHGLLRDGISTPDL